MNTVFSTFTASISELKKSPGRVLEAAGGEPVAILNHNRPTAYLLPAKAYEDLMERLDDSELGAVVRQRASEKPRAKTVSLDEL